MAGRQVFEIRVLSLCHLFALYAMADFNPPPLFSLTNTESDEANAGGVIISHGEISCPVVDFGIVPCRIHVHVDPGPDTTTTASPPLPGQKPENWVQLKISLVDASSFSGFFRLQSQNITPNVALDPDAARTPGDGYTAGSNPAQYV